MVRDINALIVDDSPTTRKLIIAALHQTGLAKFNFTQAMDGIDALEKFRPGVTQIIFVDMNMPRMDGLEFVRQLHAKHRVCPPAVMITGESSRDRLQEALNETGVDAFLLKPVDRDRLRSGLKTLVDSIPELSGPWVVPHGECVPQAVQEVLREACDLELTPEPDDETIRVGDIVLGMVSVLGDVQWSLVLGFARETAVAVAARFVGPDFSPDEIDLGDAIGELANIVGGRVKSLLTSRDLTVKVSLPTVLEASRFRILVQRRRKTTADYAHFNSSVGKLWSEVTVGIHAGMVL